MGWNWHSPWLGKLDHSSDAEDLCIDLPKKRYPAPAECRVMSRLQGWFGPILTPNMYGIPSLKLTARAPENGWFGSSRFGSSPINTGVFNSPAPLHTQHVESSWAHGPLVCMCHGKRRWYSVCTPKSVGQTQNSGQLYLLLPIWPNVYVIIACAIGALPWNKPLHHSGTAVWRSVHSWLLFGCQGRPSWISRSGTRFQCWHNSRQCLGFGGRSPPTIRAQLCGFRYYVCDHRWCHQGLPRHADCTGPHCRQEQLVDCRHKVPSSKRRHRTDVPLQP